MPMLPINREDGGQTYLTDPNSAGQVQVSRVAKNPFATISGDTGTVDLGTGQTSSPMSAAEYAGLLQRFNLSPIPETPANITQARSDVLGAYNPTAQETQYQTQVNDLQGQLDKLNAQERAGVGQIQEMPASSRFADAQMRQFQLGMSRQKSDVLAQMESAQRNLGYETAKRQGLLQRATAALGFAQSDYDNQLKRIDQINQNNMDIMSKVIIYAQGLQDNQRQALATIAKNFENSSQTFDQMTPQGQQGVINLARQWGLDPQAVVATINSQAHNNLLKQQKDTLTTINNLAQTYPDAGIKSSDTLEMAQQKVASSKSFLAKNQPNIVQEYEYAKSKGYTGSFTQYQNEDANRKLKATGTNDLTPYQIQQTINQISGQFDNEPVVKNYNIVSEGYQFAKQLGSKTTPTASDDQGLIYAFAKAMDPNSVVREGEYATVQKYAQSWAESFGFKAERIFSNTVFLTKEARQNMIDTIKSKYNVSDKNYRNVYNEYQRRLNDAKSGKINGSITDYSKAFQDNTTSTGNVQNDLKDDITNHIADYKTREDLIRALTPLYPEMTQNEIAKIVYSTVSDTQAQQITKNFK